MSFGQTKAGLLLLFLLLHASIATAKWQKLSSGLDYQKIQSGAPTPWSTLHAFRIDLQKLELSLIMAKDLKQPNATVREFSKAKSAFLGINGGFFDHSFHPLGLRIQDGLQRNSVKAISWWGIFYLLQGKPYIGTINSFPKNEPVDFAVQSGPRLLVNGEIPHLKAGRAERSALCIREDGRVIIAVTDHKALTTTELASILKSAPLNCRDALNLDGGSSSQLYAHVGKFKLQVYGFSNVSDVILVRERLRSEPQFR